MTEPEALHQRRQLLLEQIGQAADEIFQDAPCKADVKIGTDWSFAEAPA